MNKFAIILLIPVLLWQPGFASDLEEALIAKVYQNYMLDPDFVDVTMHKSGLKTDDIGKCDLLLRPYANSNPRGRFLMRVELLCMGELVEKGIVTLDIRYHADLLVPINKIRRHQILTADLFTTKRFDITSLSNPMLTSSTVLDNRRATANLAPNRYVPLSRIEQIPDIENGSAVTIVGSNPLFVIRTKGKALQGGVIGETIRVKTIDTNKIITGLIVGADMVEIKL